MPLPLDGARAPVLARDEVLYRLQSGVALYDRETKLEARGRGAALLTSHRVGWLDAARAAPVAWPLAAVASAHAEEGALFGGSPRVVLVLRPPAPAPAGGAPAAGAAYPQPPSATSAAAPPFVKLSFKEGGRDAFCADVARAIARAAWAAAPAAAGSDAAAAAAAASRKVGLSAVLEVEAARASAGRALAEGATADLEALVRHSRAVAELAEALARDAARDAARAAAAAGGAGAGAGAVAGAGAGAGGGAAGAGAGAGASAGAGGPPAARAPRAEPGAAPPSAAPGEGGGASARGVDAESEAAALLLDQLGALPPVTRDAAGGLFATELARQLASFMLPLLGRLGGLCPLTDAFVAFNRARGTEPVAPADVLAAARLLGPRPPAGLGLGLHLATLPPGVLVLQLDAFSPAAAGERLLRALADAAAARARQGGGGGGGAGGGAAAAEGEPFLDAARAAAALRVPPAVAEHHLATAEAAGALCRDDSLHGVRFYPNRFCA